MTKEIPPEIKKWIEEIVAERYPYVTGNYTGLAAIRAGILLRRQDFTAGATSLYQHLQENGRVAELEKDYEVVKKDHDRLVRELDVIINGEEGAAKQASLCDIVSQLKNKKIVLYDK